MSLARRGARPRMRKPQVSRVVVVVLPIALLMVSTALLLLVDVGFDRALAIAAVLYGVATLGLSELRTRDAPTKSVVVVGIDDIAFTNNLVEGLGAELRNSVPFELNLLVPDPSERSPETWQVRQLESTAAASADALVLIPAGDDKELWTALARRLRRGVTVVCVDRSPQRAMFLDAGLRPPPHVASDFFVGGQLAGGLLADRLDADPDAHAVVALGPGESGPGGARSGKVLYELARRGMTGRVVAVELDSWALADAVSQLMTLLEPLLKPSTNHAVVFCGDDRIAVAMDRRCAARREWDGRVELVGYDGARGVDDRLLAFEHDLVIATVDTQPRAQGAVVAQILREAYHHEASQDTERRLVAPLLVRPVAGRG